MAIQQLHGDYRVITAEILYPTYRRWFGKKEAEVDLRIRKWTVPSNDCVAWPTLDFYTCRSLLLSNEGNILYPKYVALDRYNDADWDKHLYTIADCVPATLQITDRERFIMRNGRWPRI